MNDLWRKLVNYWAVEASDPEEELSGKILRFTTMTMTGVFLTFAIHYFIEGVPSIAVLQLVVATVSFIAFWIYKATKSTVYAANFILCFGVISAFARAYLMGGIQSPAFFIWPIIPVCTMALMPFRWAAFWSGLYIAIALFFHVADKLGYAFPSKVSPEGLSAVRIFAIVVVQFILISVMFFFKQLNRFYRDMIRTKTEEKTNLVRMITHDVASPITVLKHHAKKLEKKFGSQPEIDKILKAIDVIHGISTEVRELEAIQSGKRSLILKPVCLNQMVKDLVAFLDVRIQEKGIFVDVHSLDLCQDVMVMADEKLLSHQVIGNLLTNAIKFTDVKGRIAIQIKKEPGWIHLEIRDNGIGMPKELIQKIFDPTRQTTRMGTSGEPGTGFGMPILKSSMERFQGLVSIESQCQDESPSQHGTTVRLSFPEIMQTEQASVSQ